MKFSTISLMTKLMFLLAGACALIPVTNLPHSIKPKEVIQIKLPVHPYKSAPYVSMKISGGVLYGLFWAHPSKDEATLELFSADTRSGAVIRSIELAHERPDSKFVTRPWMEVSAHSGLLLCFAQILSVRQSFKRLWTIRPDNFAVVSSADPAEVTGTFRVRASNSWINESGEPVGFTGNGRNVRLKLDSISQGKSVSFWDVDATNLKKVMSMHVVKMLAARPAIGMTRVTKGGDLWVRSYQDDLDQYEIAAGKHLRSFKLSGIGQPLVARVPHGFLMAARLGRSSYARDWGANLILYGDGGKLMIKGRPVPDCVFSELCITADGKYVVTVCDGSRMNKTPDVQEVEKLQAMTFKTDDLNLVASIPMNERYDDYSVAIDSTKDGILEAIADHPDRIRLYKFPFP